jgi:hypothetical protein
VRVSEALAAALEQSVEALAFKIRDGGAKLKAATVE